jgi:hypothetical protein
MFDIDPFSLFLRFLFGGSAVLASTLIARNSGAVSWNLPYSRVLSSYATIMLMQGLLEKRKASNWKHSFVTYFPYTFLHNLSFYSILLLCRNYFFKYHWLSTTCYVSGTASVSRAAGFPAFFHYLEFESASLTNKNLTFFQFSAIHLMSPQFVDRKSM